MLKYGIALVAASSLLTSPQGCESDVSVSDTVRVTINLGEVQDLDYDPVNGNVTFELDQAPSVFTVRGEWDDALAYTESFITTIPASYKDGNTSYDFGSNISGTKVTLVIPYDLASVVVDGRADASYSSGGYYYSQEEGLSYTVTWPDYCGQVWPCPADDGLRLIWDVIPPTGGEGLWLAEDSRGTATDAYHVAWAWWENGVVFDVSDTRRIVGSSSKIDAMKKSLGYASSYLDMFDEAWGPRPMLDFGMVDTGNWGTADNDYGEIGAMEHQPYEYMDTEEGVLYWNLLYHEYGHSWFSSKIGYPHVGEMIVGEGIVTYGEGVVKSMEEGGSSLEEYIADMCLYAFYGSFSAEYPAWEPDGAAIDPPDMFLPGLPYYAGSLIFFQFASKELPGGAAGLMPYFQEIAQDLPADDYSFADIVTEIEARTEKSMEPYMAWVQTIDEMRAMAKTCDIEGVTSRVPDTDDPHSIVLEDYLNDVSWHTAKMSFLNK